MKSTTHKRILLKKMIGPLFSVLVLFFSATPAEASGPIQLNLKEVRGCEPDATKFENLGKPLSDLKALEGKTLVARKVYQIIDDYDSNARIYLETTLNPNSQEIHVVCATGNLSLGKRLSTDAPVILDLSRKKGGDAFWMFQTYRNSQGLFSWNQKSLSVQGDGLHFLKTENPNFTIRSLNENIFRVQYSQTKQGLKLNLVIEYDLLEI
jgi:hypothetical protein